ncbi:YjgB family protein [Pelotomaculum sp. FP]|uniref:YjgB family protein n=1 Tax=Pelotomaculum sp. FP TaxID=261474 RepID=UPI001FAA76E0|nr:YjgB family protein [Pelotomaculum sp. FP]
MFKKLALIIFCFSLVVAAAGCTTNKQTEPETPNTVMNDFLTLTQTDSRLEEVANFIKDNISNVSEEDASKMVDEFEKIQKKNLPQFERMFTEDSMQNKINSEYKSIITQSDIKDTELKELLAKTKAGGYKVETAEGFFFPIIDYGFYKNFSSYVTPDMKEYIALMAEESDKVPAKDAALVIGWDEVLKRALNQEKFIDAHKDSVKVSDVKELYEKYVTFVLYGANNTPLFSYDSKTLDPKAKEVYFNAVANAGNSEFITTLGGFLDLVKNNNYKLTNEVEKYREDVIQKIKISSAELSSPISEQKDGAQAALLNEIMQSARQGKIINCEFPVETTVIETVKERWGEPDKSEYIAAAKGTYTTYTKYNVVFGFNKGSQIFDVRSYRFKPLILESTPLILLFT